MNKQKGFLTNIILSFSLAGLLVIIAISPFFKGLYFQTELLPALTAVAIVFTVCMAGQARERGSGLFSHPLDMALLGLVLAYALSLINAVDRHEAVVELLKVSSLVMVYWLACRAAASEKGLSGLLFAAYAAALGLALVGLGAALGWVHFAGAYEDGHIRSALQYHNALGIYLAAATIIGLALSQRQKRWSGRLLLAGGNYLLLVTILGTLSRGTWLLLPVGLAGLVFLAPAVCRRRMLYEIIMLAVCVLLAGRFFFNSLSGSNTILSLAFLAGGLGLTLAAAAGRDVFLRCWQETAKREKRYLAAGMLVLLLTGCGYMVFHHLPVSDAVKIVLPDNAAARAKKTSLQDNSLRERLTTNQDALRIIKDYPLTGAGGGGWQALYHSYADKPYEINEVHNYYLKTWLEAGTLGLLALLAAAFLFVGVVIRGWKQSGGSEESLGFTAAAVAAIIMGLHSLIDFELSMAGVGFLFYALIGACRGYSASIKMDKRPSPEVKKGKTHRRQGPGLSPASYIPIIVAGLAALSAAILSARFCYAGHISEQAARSLEARNLDEAWSLYQKASRLDPYEGAYQVNLAQVAAIKASQSQDQPTVAEAVSHARQAAGLEPYNASLRQALFSIYGGLGMVDEQLQEAEAAIKADPFQGQTYEMFARTAMGNAWACLDKGRQDEANIYFTRVLALRERVPPDTAPSTPGLNLAAGQAALMLGDFGKARELLARSVQEESYRKTARLWLGAAEHMSGQARMGGNREKIDLQELLIYLNQAQRESMGE